MKITISASVNAPIDKVWEYWNNPTHVTQWNAADPSWHSPRAENDLRVGGKFNYRMEAKDGSFGFDFEGTYTDVVMNVKIAYDLGDTRKVETTFVSNGETTDITTIFDAETENSEEMQKRGWQSILNNFKTYTESH